MTGIKWWVSSLPTVPMRKIFIAVSQWANIQWIGRQYLVGSLESSLNHSQRSISNQNNIVWTSMYQNISQSLINSISSFWSTKYNSYHSFFKWQSLHGLACGRACGWSLTTQKTNLNYEMYNYHYIEFLESVAYYNNKITRVNVKIN